MRKFRLSTTPPVTRALIGRASPKGSSNVAGLNKGIDMPNQSATEGLNMSPLGSASAKYKHDTPQLGVVKFGDPFK